MSKYKLCQKWELELDDSLGSYDGKLRFRPYTHYLVKKRVDIAYNLWCVERVLECVDGVKSIVEYFAGVGLSALTTEMMLKPDEHVLMDLDPMCVEMIKQTCPWASEVLCADYYEVAGVPCDLAFLDIETFTMLKMQSRDFDALRRTFASSCLVLLVDTAIGKYHLNHQAYSNEMREPLPTVDDYLKSLSSWYQRNFGFSVALAASHVRATYLLMSRTDEDPRQFQHIIAPESVSHSYFTRA